jgi:thiol-disulfide isomerase/thioredoxin
MMKSWIPALALGCALASTLAAQDKGKKGETPPAPAEKTDNKKVEPLKVGATADENLVLRDLDGKEMKLKDLRGKTVFIHFWSTVCPYEPAAEPKFQALLDRYKGKDVVQLAIASNQGELGPEPAKGSKDPTYPDIRAHVEQTKSKYPIIIDRGNKISDYFGGRTTPHCFVIDAKGVLVYAGGLDDDPRASKGDEAQFYVRDAIDAAMAGKEVKVKESKPYG